MALSCERLAPPVVFVAGSSPVGQPPGQPPQPRSHLDPPASMRGIALASVALASVAIASATGGGACMPLSLDERQLRAPFIRDRTLVTPHPTGETEASTKLQAFRQR